MSPFDRAYARFNSAKVERHPPEATSDPWDALLLRESRGVVELDVFDLQSS